MWVPDRNSEATVVDEVDHRSYEIETSEGTYRRNCRDIVPLPELPQGVNTPATTGEERAENSNTSRRSSRATQPPERYDPSWTYPTSEGRCSVILFVSLLICMHCSVLYVVHCARVLIECFM